MGFNNNSPLDRKALLAKHECPIFRASFLKEFSGPSFEGRSCHVLVLKVVYDIDSVTHFHHGLAQHSYA